MLWFLLYCRNISVVLFGLINRMWEVVWKVGLFMWNLLVGCVFISWEWFWIVYVGVWGVCCDWVCGFYWEIVLVWLGCLFVLGLGSSVLFGWLGIVGWVWSGVLGLGLLCCWWLFVGFVLGGVLGCYWCMFCWRMIWYCLFWWSIWDWDSCVL